MKLLSAATMMLAGAAGLSSSNADTIVDVAVSTGVHDRLVEILTTPSYQEIFWAVGNATGEAPLTVMAPTDTAFAAAEAALGFDFVETTDADQIAAVSNVLLYHVFGGNQSSTALVGGYATETVQGQKMIIKVDDGAKAVGQNTVSITALDQLTENGIIHVVDGVILPPQSVFDIAAAETSTLYSILTAEEFKPVLDAVGGLDSLTVFAPTNKAFEDAGVDLAFAKANVEAVSSILSYHVVASEVFAGAVEAPATVSVTTVLGEDVEVSITADGVTVGGVDVVAGDVLAAEGVVHVIDAVLSIPQEEEEETMEPTAGVSTLTSGVLSVVVSSLAMLFNRA